MELFEYSAVGADGATERQRTAAESVMALDRMLERRGLVLVRAHPVRARRGGARPRLDRSQLVGFTAQLATMIEAGVPVLEGVEGVAERIESDAARALVQDLAVALRGGASLSEAMDRHPRTFPVAYRATVQAGETAGALDTVLRRLADYLRWQRSIRASTVQALIYPAVLLGAIAALVVLLLAFVLPRILTLFPEDAVLPAQTRTVMTASDFVTGNALVLGTGALAVAALFSWGVRRPGGRMLLHRFLLRIPVLGTILRRVAMARFASTASMLYAAGCDMFTVLGVAGDSCGNEPIKAGFRDTSRAIQQGDSITEALEAHPYRDPLLVQMVAVGERTGELDRCMQAVVRHFDEEIPAAVRRFITLLQPLLLLLAGGAVAYILLAALLPVFEIYENIG